VIKSLQDRAALRTMLMLYAYRELGLFGLKYSLHFLLTNEVSDSLITFLPNRKSLPFILSQIHIVLSRSQADV
jgi:hypothetical protein